MIINRAWSIENRGRKKVLIFILTTTNYFLLPSIRTSVESAQLRPAPALGSWAEPALALGRDRMKPRAVWVAPWNFPEKFFFQNFRSGEGYPGVFVWLATTHIHISPHQKFQGVFKKSHATKFQNIDFKKNGSYSSKQTSNIQNQIWLTKTGKTNSSTRWIGRMSDSATNTC